MGGAQKEKIMEREGSQEKLVVYGQQQQSAKFEAVVIQAKKYNYNPLILETMK